MTGSIIFFMETEDLEKIKEAGFDPTVAVVVSNIYLFPKIEVMGYGSKKEMDELLECS